jgi:SAM-dependent methyltransferase
MRNSKPRTQIVRGWLYLMHNPKLKTMPLSPSRSLPSSEAKGSRVNSAKSQNSELRTQNSERWVFACPACCAPLESARPDELHCQAHGDYLLIDGIWHMLLPERAAYFAPFLRDYTAIRSAEGYGYDAAERYRRLPEANADDPLAWQWRMRARSFAELRRRVLEPMQNIREGTRRNANNERVPLGLNSARVGDERRETRDERQETMRSYLLSLVSRLKPLAYFSRPIRGLASLRVSSRIDSGLRVLDMGAGVGWLSHQLACLGHAPCAVDLNLDPRDGLGAARHYPAHWPLLQAEFDRLPLADAQADVVVFNAALPYSGDYRVTLAEALRVLRPGGRIVVVDSPIYRCDASGRQMVAERQAAFERIHGTRSDALPSIGYLTWSMLDVLGRDLGLRWRAFFPWYGWRWALRPWRAGLLRQREPSTFAVLVAERSNV